MGRTTPTCAEWRCIRPKLEVGFIRRTDGKEILLGDLILVRQLCFLTAILHFHFSDDDSDKSVCLAAVDTNGETLTKIRVPGGINHGYIQQSQGYLHYTNLKKDEDSDVHRLLVYVLKDYGTKEWTLKHSVETS